MTGSQLKGPRSQVPCKGPGSRVPWMGPWSRVSGEGSQVEGPGCRVPRMAPMSQVPGPSAAFLYVPFETVLNQTFYDSNSKKFWIYLFANIEQKIVMIISWWSEMPVSQAIDFVSECLLSYGQCLLGYSPCSKMVFWSGIQIKKTHINFVIEYYQGLCYVK